MEERPPALHCTKPPQVHYHVTKLQTTTRPLSRRNHALHRYPRVTSNTHRKIMHAQNSLFGTVYLQQTLTSAVNRTLHDASTYAKMPLNPSWSGVSLMLPNPAFGPGIRITSTTSNAECNCKRGSDVHPRIIGALQIVILCLTGGGGGRDVADPELESECG